VSDRLENIVRERVLKEKKRPSLEPKTATAGTLATKKLKAMGLSREEYNALWNYYKQLYYRRRQHA